MIYDDFKAQGFSPKAAWNKLRRLSRKIGTDVWEISEYAVDKLGFTTSLASEVQWENDEDQGFSDNPTTTFDGMLSWLRRMTA